VSSDNGKHHAALAVAAGAPTRTAAALLVTKRMGVALLATKRTRTSRFSALYRWGMLLGSLLDHQMSCKFESGRNIWAGLHLSRAGPKWTNFGEIRMIRFESQNLGSNSRGSSLDAGSPSLRVVPQQVFPTTVCSNSGYSTVPLSSRFALVLTSILSPGRGGGRSTGREVAVEWGSAGRGTGGTI
jgi:hypothetical protein